MLPVMEVSSRLTARRGVSLPSSDFCEPLISEDGDPKALYKAAMAYGEKRGWKYLECRNVSGNWCINGDQSQGDHPGVRFHGHIIELDRSEKELFKGLDAAMRRAVRKAQDERITVEFGDTLDS